MFKATWPSSLQLSLSVSLCLSLSLSLSLSLCLSLSLSLPPLCLQCRATVNGSLVDIIDESDRVVVKKNLLATECSKLVNQGR